MKAPSWFVALLAGFASLAIAGCGGGATTLGLAHGPSTATPLSLSLATTDGRVIEISDQRGALVLLFVLATYDGLSQAEVRAVSRFTREATDTVVLGVVAERDAPSFAPIYAEALAPPFTVVYDAAATITAGTSALGELPGVPTFYMIDAHGLLVERRTGYLTEAELFAMRDHARARGGVTPATP